VAPAPALHFSHRPPKARPLRFRAPPAVSLLGWCAACRRCGPAGVAPVGRCRSVAGVRGGSGPSRRRGPSLPIAVADMDRLQRGPGLCQTIGLAAIARLLRATQLSVLSTVS
jgi:hypothetical protein